MQRLNRDDGAVLVFVALMVVCLIGFGAIAVDAGALYQEHRQLQNAADAAALAVAQDCASGAGITACYGGNADADVRAEYYSDANAEDNTVDAAVDLTQWAANKVRVDTTTVDATNTADPGQITLFFARIFGIQGGDAAADATATWGPPAMGSIKTLPLTVSQCEYDNAIVSQGGLVDPVPSSTVDETVILFHAGDSGGGGTAGLESASASLDSSFGAAQPPGKGGGKPSPTPPPTPTPTPEPEASATPAPEAGNGGGGGGGGNNGGGGGNNGGGGGGGNNGGGGGGGGQDPDPDGDCAAVAGHDTDGDQRLPGGFGWLQNTGVCEASINGNQSEEDPGNAPDQGACSPETLRDEVLNKVVLLPIFVDVDGEGGSNGTYTMIDYAAFYVTGYSFTGQYKEPQGVTCDSATAAGGNSSTCLRGWFTTGVASGGTIGSGPGLGANLVALDD